jgi:hypothetical protein
LNEKNFMCANVHFGMNEKTNKERSRLPISATVCQRCGQPPAIMPVAA